MKFLIPIVAGVAIALLGTLIQELVVDHRGGVGPAAAAADDPAAAPGALEVPAIELVGVVVARDVVEVAARAAGRITAIPAQLGDRVERRAVLASLDDRDLRDELTQAQAVTRALTAERDNADSELAEARERRARAEHLSYVISDQELASARYQEKYAESKLQSTRARLDEQQTRVSILARSIEEAQIRAPFDGLIAARYIGPGTMVSAGTPIVRIVSSGDVRVRFAIPEALGGQVRVGLPIAIDVEAAALTGTVDKIAPEVDAASRMIVAEARVVVPDGLPETALTGRVARVRVRTVIARPTP